jgi:hypothetical protein
MDPMSADDTAPFAGNERGGAEKTRVTVTSGPLVDLVDTSDGGQHLDLPGSAHLTSGDVLAPDPGFTFEVIDPPPPSLTPPDMESGNNR